MAKKQQQKKYDLICPTHYVDWKYFSSNVQSWFDNLPIKTLYLGNNNPDPKYRKMLKEFVEGFENAVFVDQTGIKTLGYQITDLMKKTEGDVFIYNHADVRIAPHSILVMEATLEDDVGIVESERVQYDYEHPKEYPDQYPYYYYRTRSFSGFQLIRKESIWDIVEKIEDDYVYRNEDIIFQNACTKNGFRYEKALSALHVHTCSMVNQKWTPQGEYTTDEETIAETFDMQIKGIVKYCTPDEITRVAWRDAFGVAFQKCGVDLFEFIEEFVMKVNPIWREAIQETISDLIRGIYGGRKPL